VAYVAVKRRLDKSVIAVLAGLAKASNKMFRILDMFRLVNEGWQVFWILGQPVLRLAKLRLLMSSNTTSSDPHVWERMTYATSSASLKNSSRRVAVLISHICAGQTDNCRLELRDVLFN